MLLSTFIFIYRGLNVPGSTHSVPWKEAIPIQTVHGASAPIYPQNLSVKNKRKYMSVGSKKIL